MTNHRGGLWRRPPRRPLQRGTELKSGCPTLKKRFRTEAAALKALEHDAQWRQEGQEKRNEQRVYECYRCLGYHLTSEEKRNGLKQTKPLPFRSAKTAALYRDERIPLVEEMLTAYPICQIAWDERCTHWATEVDEKCGRGRGGDMLDRDNLQTCCNSCHRAKTLNPAEAEARGFGTSSADYRRGREA